jgi:hypothetical protein
MHGESFHFSVYFMHSYQRASMLANEGDRAIQIQDVLARFPEDAGVVMEVGLDPPVTWTWRIVSQVSMRCQDTARGRQYSQMGILQLHAQSGGTIVLVIVLEFTGGFVSK